MNKWWAIMTTILGLFVLSFISVYYWQSTKNDAMVLGITETIRSASMKNVDYSSRAEEGILRINLENFEEDFKVEFQKNTNVNMSEPTYEFKYLKTEDGGIKAIRVKVSSPSGTYQSTVVVDIENER